MLKMCRHNKNNNKCSDKTTTTSVQTKEQKQKADKTTSSITTYSGGIYKHLPGNIKNKLKMVKHMEHYKGFKTLFTKYKYSYKIVD